MIIHNTEGNPFMPDFFKYLLNPLSFSIILTLIIIAIVIISLKGRFMATIGNKVFKLGDVNDSGPKEGAPITNIKRSCGDCILLVIGEREKAELKMRREQDKVLKTQMTFAEQKLAEIQNKIIENISSLIDNETSDIEESIQYKLIYGLLKDALIQVKDEIRRSFKDNGFYYVTNPEFSYYVKDRIKVITSMLTQYLRNIYPDGKKLLEIEKINFSIERDSAFFAAIINDVYNFARETKIEAEKRIDNIGDSFGEWIDNFIN